MKGFLDKTWAKAAAFVLTLVFGVLTVLGGVGVGILISYDVFLDGGDFLRQTMYEGNCVRSIDTADSFLRGTLANAGVLVSDGTYDYSTVESGDVTEEERAQVISDLPRVFAEEFSRDAADCHLTVTVRGNGEVVGTFENFELTDGDKPLYTTQETFTYALNTGNTAMVTIAADLLRTEEAPSYSYLLDMWLVEHTALTVILTVLFAALALFFFCFLMASAGHWAGHEGIHLTWLDKIPADVWLIVLLCTFFIGWEAFYYGWGRVFFCAALVPLVLLFLCAFAAQCKAGTVLRSALIARIVRFLWRIVRSLFLGLWRIAKSLPLIWKTALAGLILVFIEFVLFMQDYYGTLAAPFLALKLAELLAVLYVALNLRALQKGGEKLARGDFSSPIDTKYLIGDFKRYGQELNDVQSGLEQAVQEQWWSSILQVLHMVLSPGADVLVFRVLRVAGGGGNMLLFQKGVDVLVVEDARQGGGVLQYLRGVGQFFFQPDQGVAHAGRGIFRQAVIDPAAFLNIFNQSGLPQQEEMLGGGRSRQTQQCGDFADAERAVAQGHEYADAALVPQGADQIEKVEHEHLRCRSTGCGRSLADEYLFQFVLKRNIGKLA